MVEVISHSDSTQFFDRPAVFVSASAPGFVAGGPQCTLAYIQALAELHHDRLTYLGPPLSSCKPADPPVLKVVEQIEINDRGPASKMIGLLSLRYVDRITPSAKRHLRSIKDSRTVVYVNGEAAGSVVRTAKELGFSTVFLPHNYASEYLDANTRYRNPIRSLYAHIAARNALTGCSYADLNLFLTKADMISYAGALSSKGLTLRGIDSMYFGYHDDGKVLKYSLPTLVPAGFTVLLNTNLGAPQNEEGVLYFLKDIWPLHPPGVAWNLILAGGYPSEAIKLAIAGVDSVELIVAPTPDQMELVFARSSVCVAASLRGRGIKLRIAESLRRGMPVLSTQHCSRGYEKIDSQVLRIFDTPESAIHQLQELQSADRFSIAVACLNQYRSHMGFEAGLAKMRAIAKHFNYSHTAHGNG